MSRSSPRSVFPVFVFAISCAVIPSGTKKSAIEKTTSFRDKVALSFVVRQASETVVLRNSAQSRSGSGCFESHSLRLECAHALSLRGESSIAFRVHQPAGLGLHLMGLLGIPQPGVHLAQLRTALRAGWC